MEPADKSPQRRLFQAPPPDLDAALVIQRGLRALSVQHGLTDIIYEHITSRAVRNGGVLHTSAAEIARVLRVDPEAVRRAIKVVRRKYASTLAYTAGPGRPACWRILPEAGQ